MDVKPPSTQAAGPSAVSAEEVRALRERVRALEAELRQREATQALAGDPALFATARGLLAATGRTFFRSLLGHLSAALKADFAFVGEPVPDAPNRARTTVLLVDGREQANFEYDLAGTPCDHVFTQDLCVHASGVQEQFPRDALLAEMGVEGYAGTPLLAADGTVLGIMVLMWRRPLEDPARAEATLQLFAMRAAAELERLLAEQKLRRSEMLLRSILDHTTTVVSVKQPDGRYLLVNRQFERLFGLQGANLPDRTCHDIVPHEEAERIRAHDLEVLRTRAALQCEETATLPNGERHTFLVAKVPLFDAEGTIVATCGISTDITERKRLEAQLVRAQRMESIGHLAGGVAHDFNNLLTAIGGYISLTLEGLPEGHPTRRELEEAHKGCERAAVLTSQLLAFARKQVIQPRDVCLALLLHDMQALLRPMLGENVRVNLRLAAGLWPVHVDPGQLEQVLMNLAVNARDAMPEGGTLEIAATNLSLAAPRGADEHALPAGDYVEIRVRDTGHGIPESVRPHLFDPFFTTKEAGKGTGLGLATCYGIAEQSGGRIEFEPGEGVGATFVLLLPRGGDVVAVAPSIRDTAPARGDEVVLVVEDDDLVLQLEMRSLEQSGFTVLGATGGDQALATAADWSGPIDLLVSDVVMPGMSGPELATRLRLTRPEIRVLLVSGYPDAGAGRRAQDAAAWPLLQKPYTPLELSARVRAVLDGVPA